MLKKLPRNSRRQLTGWLLAALTALFLTSEPVDRLYALPDSLHLTPGCGTSLFMPPLIEADVEGSAAVLSSMDESLAGKASSVRLAAGQPGR